MKHRSPGIVADVDKRPTQGAHAAPGGYTLLELTLVLVLIVSIFAIGWPLLTRRLANHDLRQAGMQVAEALVETRLGAMETGQPWALCFVAESNQLKFGPLDQMLDQHRTSMMGGGLDLPNTEDQSFSESNDWLSEARSSAAADSSVNAVINRSVTEVLISDAFHLVDRVPRPDPNDRRLDSLGETDLFDLQEDSLTVSDQAVDSIGVDGENRVGGVTEQERRVGDSNSVAWIIFDSLGQTSTRKIQVAYQSPTRDTAWQLTLAIDGMTGAVEVSRPTKQVGATEREYADAQD